MAKNPPRTTREPQYQFCIDYADERGLESLGLMTSQTWYDDPRRLLFTLSRYKFVAKMFDGMGHVLEVGCGDGFGTRIVRQAVDAVTATDFDPVFIEDARSRSCDRWDIEFTVHDMLQAPLQKQFDSAYALDVLEHVSPEDEGRFLENICGSLKPGACCIMGMPSLESQAYASRASREGHVNCKSMPEFRDLMQGYFAHVLGFSMNDEVVHTGFHKMANYLLVVGTGRK